MSSYFPTPQDIDPISGLPKKKKQQNAINQAWAPYKNQITQSLAQNPGTFAGAFYGPTGSGRVQLPGLPDYRGLIDNDATYSQAKLDFGAQGVSDAAQRGAMTQRALTLFGGPIPEFGQMAGLNQEFLNQDVTPVTRQLAQANTDAGLSIAARQAKAFKDQVRQIKNALASRGALRSGEAGYQLQNAQLGYDQAKFDSSDELQQFIGGLQAGFAEKQRQEKLRLAREAAEAEARVRQLYPAEAVPAGGYGALPGSGPLPDPAGAPTGLPDPPAAPAAPAEPPAAPAAQPVASAPIDAQTQALLNSMIGSAPGDTLTDVFLGRKPPTRNQAIVDSMIGSGAGATLADVIPGYKRRRR